MAEHIRPGFPILLRGTFGCCVQVSNVVKRHIWLLCSIEWIPCHLRMWSLISSIFVCVNLVVGEDHRCPINGNQALETAS